MNNLNDKIQEIYNSTPDYIHNVSIGNKIKNGIETNDISIVFFVHKKLPIEEIPENEKIPSSIEIEGKTYKTDVIENSGFSAIVCYGVNDPKITFLQSRQRPLSGGLEITNFFKWKEVEPFVFNTEVGTLGLIAVDNTDNTLVGLTNSHVAILDAFNSSERDQALELTNIRDDKDYVSNFGQAGFNATVNPNILQWGSSPNKNLETDKIGSPKRYYPFSIVNINYIDAAICTIRQNFVDLNSASQALLVDTFAMPFATTAEINSLAADGENYGASISSCGRTTGPKGDNCPMTVKYISTTSSVSGFYIQGKNDVEISFSDCLQFQYVDGSDAPVLGGDSGSALIANFNGINKIIGLVFAGNSIDTPNYGLACRIDRISELLNISAWDGTAKSFTPYPPQIDFIFRPKSDNRPYVDYQGKRYWQAGLINATNQVTEIPL
jgi:hypothetical protein